MVVGTSLEETLKQASVKFGEEVVELRSAKGGVIDDIAILRYIKITHTTARLFDMPDCV